MNALGIVKTPQLGGDVDAWCGKCKDTREHVIAALDDKGAVSRVQCRTCQGNHIYRQRQSRTASTRTSTRTSRKDPAIELDESGPLRPYSMKDSFNVGDRVEHVKFGIGLVVNVRAEKIDVKFGRELKILLHAG